MAKFEKGHKKVGGRKKGVPDRIHKEFKDLMHSILFDDQDVTRSRLLALRDSEEASDRKTFWTIATKLLPQKVEGKLDVGIPTLLLDQNYVLGQTSEREIDSSGEGENKE